MIPFKKLAVIAAFTLSSSTLFAQNTYIKIGAAYNLPTSFSYQEQISESYNPNGGTVNYSAAKQNFGQGVALNGAIGHAFNKHIGLELGVNYLLNSKNEAEDMGFISGYGVYAEYHQKQETYARLFLLQPSVVASLGKEKVNPYVRFGVILPFGKIITDEIFTQYQTEQKQKSETKGSFHVGFQQALGLELEARKNVYLFTEITATNLAFVPKTKSVVEATLNGDDVLNQLSVKGRETEFVETVPENYTYDRNKEQFIRVESSSSPTKSLRKNYSLNTLGFGLGLKFNF